MTLRVAFMVASQPNDAFGAFVSGLPSHLLQTSVTAPYGQGPLPPADVYCLYGQELLLPFLATNSKTPSPLAAKTVLLNADRYRVSQDVQAYGLLGAIDRYALYRDVHPARRPRGAYWLHGRLSVARVLPVEISPLFSGGEHCAFGGPRFGGLAELLGLYLEACNLDSPPPR